MTAEQSGSQSRLETPAREPIAGWPTAARTSPAEPLQPVPEELEYDTLPDPDAPAEADPTRGPPEDPEDPDQKGRLESEPRHRPPPVPEPAPVLTDHQLWREGGPSGAPTGAATPVMGPLTGPAGDPSPGEETSDLTASASDDRDHEDGQEAEEGLVHSHEVHVAGHQAEAGLTQGRAGLEDEVELTGHPSDDDIIIAGAPDDDTLLQDVLSELSTNISILGSGGAGNNTVHRLVELGIEGTKVIALNTDAQHLLNTHTHRKILLGRNLTKGLGAGSLPRIGEGAAEESRKLVTKAIQGSDIVFLTCGLGGGTGTGSLPLLTSMAREIGALTIAIVTLPFKSEGAIRMANAVQGLTKLREVADTVIVIPNDRLLEVAPLMPLNQAFAMADDILGRAIKCMTDITTKPGLINIDFADLRTIMRSGGVAMVGSGESSAENRAVRAVEEALSSPLLQVDITGAQGALVNVTGGADMTLQEAEQVLKVVQQKINKEARIIWGASVDETLEQKLRVMLVVTGVRSSQILGPTSRAEQELEHRFGIDFVQ